MKKPFRLAVRSALCLVLAFATTAPIVAAEATETASYRVRFSASWSANTHPINFPSSPANPHFSPLIGASHGAGASIWRPGAVASDGIEAMAETGATSPLDQEVMAAINAGTALQVIQGGGVGTSPGSANAFFTVSQDHPLVSLVTMVAPSPDWFVGVYDYNLFENGNWVEEKVATLFAWDAGTDNGGTFIGANSDTQPPGPIQRIESGSLGNGVPLGTFTFTRQDSPGPDPLILRGGRFKVTLEWQDFSLTRAGANPQPLTDETGYFWFFNATNVESVVKILDGCGSNGHFWVFAGGLTNVGVEMRVEDTETGQVNVYSNNLGDPYQPIQDTAAFATCP
ncbi:MAG: spondin domain-containing protein [Acidobacteriota bacterium]